MSVFKRTIICILGLAVLFTTLGITGSSLGMLDRLHVVTTGSRHIWGEPQAYRGDEWAVHTPSAIAQYNHIPRFPVINTNTGIDGTNMLLVHMTGVPVWHISALAKPATWGFFFLPLRNALAWYWWCPIICSILGLYMLLYSIFQKNSWVNLVLSLGFTFSLHSIAFSFWPAYVSSFAWFSASSLILLCRATRNRMKFFYGICFGFSLGGLFFTLYVPWIIPCCWLVIIIVSSVIITEKLFQRWNFSTYMAFLIGCMVLCFLIIPWYLSVKDALAVINASTYPGKRFTVGGDWPLWAMVKGWVSLFTFYNGALSYDPKGYNLYPYMVIPLLMLFVKNIHTFLQVDRQWSYSRATLFFLLSIGIVFTAIYQYVGIPSWVAKYTGFAFSHGFGADIFIGAAQIFLFAILVYSMNDYTFYVPTQAAALSLLWIMVLGYLSLFVVMQEPSTLSSSELLMRKSLAIICAFSCSYLFLRGYMKCFIVLYISSIICASLYFNPLYFAATGIYPVFSIPSDDSVRYQGRMLMLNMTGQNHMWAGGYKVFNTTQFYVDGSIYRMIYIGNKNSEKFYKYNFMDCRIDKVDNPKFYELFYTPDSNRVVFDGENYDFSQLPIDYVIIPQADMSLLEMNRSVNFLNVKNNIACFKVRR